MLQRRPCQRNRGGSEAVQYCSAVWDIVERMYDLSRRSPENDLSAVQSSTAALEEAERFRKLRKVPQCQLSLQKINDIAMKWQRSLISVATAAGHETY